MRHRSLKLAPLVAALAVGAAVPAHAESTGWINANDLKSFSNHTLQWQRYMPVSIQCKNNDAVVGMDRRNTLLKVEYVPNPRHIGWYWAWGASVGAIDHKYGPLGFKMISEGSFRRPSGLLMRCAVWQKRK